MRATLLVSTLSTALAACTGTAATTTAYTPPPGVLVRAESLVGSIGCGAGDAQIFKYSAVLLLDNQSVVGAAGTFDCFADAKFTNLPSDDGGVTNYVVQVYAFTRSAYLAQNGGGAIDGVADWPALQKLVPTYKTTCTATQQNVEVLAVCPAFASGAQPASPDAGP